MGEQARIALTMAERLAVQYPADRIFSKTPEPGLTLVPMLPRFRQPRNGLLATALASRSKASDIEVKVRGRVAWPAVELRNLSAAQAKKLAKDTKFVWHAGPRGWNVCFAGSRGFSPVRSTADLVPSGESGFGAVSRGAGLAAGAPPWKSARVPGWHSSALGANCDCGSAIQLLDWWHPDALPTRNNHVAFCPRGCYAPSPVATRWKRILQHRREFDASLATQNRKGREYKIYTVEVSGLSTAAKTVYVGQTSKSIDERLREHGDPNHPRPVRIFNKKNGGKVGDLVSLPMLQDMRLLSLSAALTGESWVAEALRLKGLRVEGGH